MRPRSSLGIYFEGDRIDLVSSRKAFQGVHVKAAHSLGLHREGKEEGFYAKLREFIKETRSEKSQVTIGLSRKDVMLFSLNLPSPTEENLRQVLGYELDRISPYTNEEAYFDFQITGRDEEKKMLRVLLVVIQKKRLDDCLEILEKVKLNPDKVEISATALVKALLYHRKEVIRGRYVLLVAGKKINGLVSHEVILIDKGGLHYSRAFSSSPSEIKDELFSELERILKNKDWDYRSLKEIILSGETGREYAKVRHEIEEKTGCRTTILDRLTEGFDGETFSPQYLVSFGLSLEGLTKDRFPINLLPRVRGIKRGRQGTKMLLPLLALVFLLGSALLVTPLIRGKAALNHLLQEIGHLQVAHSSLEKLEREVEVLEQKRGQIISLQENRHKMLELTNALTLLIPENTWLTDLKVKEATVVMTGYSDASSSLIPLLERSPFFGKVGFSAPVIVTKRRQEQGYEHELEMDYDDGFDPYSFPFIESEKPILNPLQGDGIEKFKIKADLENRP